MVRESIAVKQLKSYSPRLAPTFVKAYEPLFNLNHNNIMRVVGLCPNRRSCSFRAWTNVSIQLIDAVKQGYRPIIPTDASQLLVPLITLRWQENVILRPCAKMVLKLLGEAMNNI